MRYHLKGQIYCRIETMAKYTYSTFGCDYVPASEVTEVGR